MPLPFTFTPMTLASADDVQAQFQYLEDKTIFSDYYGWDEENSSGLEFAFFGAKHVADNVVNVIAAGTVTLTPSVINYIEADGTTGAVQAVESEFTSGNIPLYQVSAGATAFGSGDVTDVRTWAKVGGGGTTYTAGDGLDLTGTEFSIADDGVTDAKIGDRTADPSQVPSGLVGNLTQWLSWITNRIKAITGETNWYDTPDTTLAAAKTHADAADPHTGHLDVDGGKPLTANWDVGGFEIENLAAPTSAGAAANKGYVDAIGAGLKPKAAVRAVASGNVNISNPGTATFDTVAFSNGDALGLVNQTTQSENGVYIFNGSGSAMTRRADLDSSGEMLTGVAFKSLFGATYAGKTFVLVTPATITLDTTALEFTQFGADATAGTVNASSNSGTGAQILKAVSGSTLPARSIVAGAGITATQNTDDVTVAVDESALDLANISGTVGPTQGGTGLTSYAAGDVIYASATDTLSKLAVNATGTNKFLRAVSGVLSWAGLLPGDLPLATQDDRGAVPPGNNGPVTDVFRRDMTWGPVSVSPNLTGTSTSSMTIPATATGTVSFNVAQAGRSWIVGTILKITRSGAGPDPNWMIVSVDSYVHPAVVANVLFVHGSGTYSGWNISPSLDPADALIPGGTTGQVLAKASDDDGDVEWVDQSGGGGSSGHAFRGIVAAVPATDRLGLRAVGGTEVVDIDDIGDGADWKAAFETNTEIDAGTAVVVDNVSGDPATGLMEIGTINECPEVEVVEGEIQNLSATTACTYNGASIVPGDSLSTIESAIRATGGDCSLIKATGTSVAAGTGPDLTTGATATATEENPSQPAPNLIDDDLDSPWNNDGGFPALIVIDMGTAQTFDTLRMYFSAVMSSIYRPRIFDVMTSSTGAFSGEETTVHSNTDALAEGWNDIPFAESTARYLGINITDADGGSSTGIYELEISLSDGDAELDIDIHYPPSAGNPSEKSSTGGTVTTPKAGVTVATNVVVANL